MSICIDRAVCNCAQTGSAVAPVFAATPSFQFGLQSSTPVYQFRYVSVCVRVCLSVLIIIYVDSLVCADLVQFARRATATLSSVRQCPLAQDENQNVL